MSPEADTSRGGYIHSTQPFISPPVELERVVQESSLRKQIIYTYIYILKTKKQNNASCCCEECTFSFATLFLKLLFKVMKVVSAVSDKCASHHLTSDMVRFMDKQVPYL